MGKGGTDRIKLAARVVLIAVVVSHAPVQMVWLEVMELGQTAHVVYLMAVMAEVREVLETVGQGE